MITNKHLLLLDIQLEERKKEKKIVITERKIEHEISK